MLFRTLALAAAVTIGASALARAAGETAKPPGRPSGMAVYRVCKADMKLYCPHMSVAGKAMKQCMKDNLDKLSPDCRTILDRYEAATKNKP